jgi:hypothetical protein
VFTDFINQGQWPTQALSVFIGLTGPAFAFAGGDAAVHVGSHVYYSEKWQQNGN